MSCFQTPVIISTPTGRATAETCPLLPITLKNHLHLLRKHKQDSRSSKKGCLEKEDPRVTHSCFTTNLNSQRLWLRLLLSGDLRTVLFIKKWNHRLCVAFLLLLLSDVATITRRGATTYWLPLDIRLMFISHVGASVNTGLRWSVALICKRLNKDLNPFIISFDGPSSMWTVKRLSKSCLYVGLI